MVFPSAKPGSADRFGHGLPMRNLHKYYPRLGDEESGQF
jgi:hypothetical protein